MKINRLWIIVIVTLIVLCIVPTGSQAYADDESITFTVNAVDDSDDGYCDGAHCSLREAIISANNHTGKDVIEFSIPGQGPHSILIEESLDTIYDPVVIDGYSQPSSSPNTNGLESGLNTVLMIELDGSQTGPNTHGLIIAGDDSTIRGLAIYGFNKGIYLNGGHGNMIQGNFIGTHAEGLTAPGNFGGITITGHATGNTVGGELPEDTNLISGNYKGSGVGMSGYDNTIRNNLVGTDVTGTMDMGNRGGIRLDNSKHNLIADNLLAYNESGIDMFDSEENVIENNDIYGCEPYSAVNLVSGKRNVVTRNTIHHNDYHGMWLSGDNDTVTDNIVILNGGSGLYLHNATETIIEGNYIGTDIHLNDGLGNSSHGIEIAAPLSNGNIIGGNGKDQGNIIAFNDGAGIWVETDSWYFRDKQNRLIGNSIFGNQGLGIDLGEIGVTPNDPGDDDQGANNLQNFPEWNADHTVTTIWGTLNTKPSAEYQIDYYANDTCDSSGHGEGQSYLGSIELSTNSSGTGLFAIDIAGLDLSDQFLTSTATDVAGNTSEFSQCTGADIAISKVASSHLISPGTPLSYVLTIENSGPWNASNVTVTDTVSSNLHLVSATPSQGSCDGTKGVESEEMLVCRLGDMMVTHSATITVNVIAMSVGDASNTAFVDSDDLDPVHANNTATETIKIAYMDYLPMIRLD